MFWAALLFQDAVGGEAKGEWKEMLWHGQQDISEAQRSYTRSFVQRLRSPAKSLLPDPVSLIERIGKNSDCYQSLQG